MAIWGTSLYENDTTCKVRNSYIEYLKNNLTNEEAYENMLRNYIGYMGGLEEPLFWYALADTQSKLKRLIPEVKDKALKWIDNIGGIYFFNQCEKAMNAWVKTIIQLKNKLEFPQELKVKKLEDFKRNPWNVSDVYAYLFNTPQSKKRGLFGKYILIQKIGDVETFHNWVFSRIQVFNQVFDTLPTLNDLESLRLLPLINPFDECTNEKNMAIEDRLNVYLYCESKNDYQGEYFTFIGNKEDSFKNKSKIGQELDWKDIDDWLSNYYIKWKCIKY